MVFRFISNISAWRNERPVLAGVVFTVMDFVLATKSDLGYDLFLECTLHLLAYNEEADLNARSDSLEAPMLAS